MAQLARQAASDPEFQGLARSLGSLDGVESFVRSRFVYRDEYEEIVRDPRFMLADMGRVDGRRVVALEGDCDDVATLFGAFAVAIHRPARLHAIRYHSNNPNFEHVFTEAYDGRQWRIMDATVPPGTVMQWLESMIEDI